jgi:hypothetical protein
MSHLIGKGRLFGLDAGDWCLLFAGFVLTGIVVGILVALIRPLRVRGGKTLRTLADARAFMLGMPKTLQLRASWQEAAEVMLEACRTGDVATATDRVERALFLNYQIDFRSANDSNPNDVA